MLGVSGVVVGILNSYDRFGAFAISPLFWNLTIILVLVVLEPLFHGQDKIYAYAIGILIGTAGPARDPGLGPAQHARTASASASTGAIPACAGSCC